ncbi:hypothetical protein D770_22010 [Flammeovirgaceae bacterium 311]|nr:hypothetical protein D770_22010 [Flammeovirgaceae bacterium 311]
MARIFSITTPTAKTDAILEDLKNQKDLLQLQVFRGVSLNPPGDVIQLAVPNLRVSEIMRILDGHELGEENGISLTSSEPDSMIPTQSAHSIERDINEGSWEEMEMTISNDSNTSINTLFILFISGVLASIGIATNSLHIVIGGMLIAPGFMPITRVALGICARHKAWYYGSIDFFKGYLVLILGAAATTALLPVIGQDPLPGTASYYVPEQKLVTYWTTVTLSSLLASAVASIAGALLVATKKSVFTSGVMIGLALVPTAALIGMGAVTGDFTIVEKAFVRFLMDVGLVFFFSLIVFTWSRFYYHKRDIRM